MVLEPEEEEAEVCTFLLFEGVAACGGALDFDVVRRGACSFLVCWQVLEVFLGCPTWLVCLVRVLILIVSVFFASLLVSIVGGAWQSPLLVGVVASPAPGPLAKPG